MENAGGGESPEEIFGRRQRQERERRGWRLEDLAARVADQGLQRHPSMYAKIEAGAMRVRLNEAAAISAAFGLLLSQMTTAAGTAEMEAELARTRQDLQVAMEDSEKAVARALTAWNRTRELTFALGAKSEVPE